MVGYRGTFAFGRDMSDVKVLNDVNVNSNVNVKDVKVLNDVELVDNGEGDGAGDERDDDDDDNDEDDDDCVKRSQT